MGGGGGNKLSLVMQNHFSLPDLSYTWHDLFAFHLPLHNSYLNACKRDSLKVEMGTKRLINPVQSPSCDPRSRISND